MLSTRLRSSLIALVLLLSCCSAVLAYSVNSELKLGADASKQVEKEMPASKNSQWQADIQSMGQRFVPYVHRKEIPYSFKVVDAKDTANAFALPGGFVYFTERMWKMMTPDERAAVMAHEITHCDKRHGVDQMLKSQQRAIWLLPVLIFAGPAAAEVVGIGDMAVGQRYSRKMEREADEEGMKLLVAAGFSPAGAVTSMKKLLSLEGTESRYEFSPLFASHPETKARIKYLTELAIKLGATPESLNLKAVDDPARLGNVTSARPVDAIVSASTSEPLNYGQKVLIKKMLWNDDAQALSPTTIMSATVLTPGRQPLLVLQKSDKHDYTEVTEGDGVYPDTTKPSDTTTTEPEPEKP